jgi:hypothetical protein
MGCRARAKTYYSERLSLSVHPVTPVVCLVILIVWLGVGYGLDAGAWEAVMGTLGERKNKSEYCEPWGTRLLLQPANSMSNFFFVLLGVWTVQLGVTDYLNKAPTRHRIASVPLWSILIGLQECYIGFGSYLYHASMLPVLQTIDVAAIYAGQCALLGYALLRFLPPRHTHHWPHAQARWIQVAQGGMLVLVCILTVLSYEYKKEMKSSVMLPASIGALAALIALHGATLLSHCGYTVVTLLLHCYHTVFTLL